MTPEEKRHVLIGIAGGSGSGKTLVASRLHRELAERGVVVIEQDSYYRDLSHLTLDERRQVNFDHPDAFDIDLLEQHIHTLLRGGAVDVPIYDYVRHNRKRETRRVADHAIILLEGIMVFCFERLRKLMDLKIFVDTPDDIRLLRRIRRDIVERGRDLESVLDHYERNVRPMHHAFVEPSKRHADIIVPRGGRNDAAIDVILTKINDYLRDRRSSRPAAMEAEEGA